MGHPRREFRVSLSQSYSILSLRMFWSTANRFLYLHLEIQLMVDMAAWRKEQVLPTINTVLIIVEGLGPWHCHDLTVGTAYSEMYTVKDVYQTNGLGEALVGSFWFMNNVNPGVLIQQKPETVFFVQRHVDERLRVLEIWKETIGRGLIMWPRKNERLKVGMDAEIQRWSMIASDSPHRTKHIHALRLPKPMPRRIDKIVQSTV